MSLGGVPAREVSHAETPDQGAISELLPDRDPPSVGLLRREISRAAPLGEFVLVLCWAVLSAFVFVEVSDTPSSRVVAGLFTGLGGAVVLVVILYRRAADRRIRQGLRDASVALQAIENVTDPELSFLILDELLDEILARARRLLEGDVASVLLASPQSRALEVRASQGATGRRPAGSDPGTAVDNLAPGGRGVIVNDVSASELRSMPSHRDVASLVAAPLLVRGEVIGVVEVATRSPHRFERRDLRLLQVVADRCAASIERARLDEAERRSRLGAGQARLHLAMLARASVCLSVAMESYQEALASLVDVVVPDFADWFAADLVDTAGELRRVAYGPVSDEPSGSVSGNRFVHRHPRGEQLVRKALVEGRVQVVMPSGRGGEAHGGEPGSSGETSEALPAAGVESMLVVPIRVLGSVSGALTFVTGAGRRGYRRSDRVAAEELAERVGVALERVLAWRETIHHAERLQRLMEAALVVNAPLAESEVLELLAQHAQRVLDATEVTITSGPPDSPVLDSAWPLGRRPDDQQRGPRLEVALSGEKGDPHRIIQVVGHPDQQFADGDTSALTLLAQVAGVALQNARLYQAVQGNEQRLRAVVDSSPLAIAELDLSGEARWWNQAASELFGWDIEAEERRKLPVTGTAEQVVESSLDRARTGEATLGTEVTASRRDGGQLELSVSTAPLEFQGEVTGVLVVVGDITERRRLMDQFHQTERLTAMARMAGGLAHDFNNLLSVILGCGEALIRQRGDDPAVQEEVGAIQRAGQRAMGLTGQLLAISHRRTVQPVVLDMNEVALAIQPMIGGVLGPTIDLEISPWLRPALVYVDQADLERAILNLAINARDAMPEGGRLTLQVTSTGAPSSGGDDRLVGLVVSDNGVGMDPETREHCLEPFFTTKGLARGTGLGLATVHATVTQAGGQVTVDSALGAGTTITLWLPAPPTDASPAPVAVGEPFTASSGTETILLVEDEPELRRLAERELRARGYTVRAAANAGDALRIAQSDLARFDVVVTDVVMPGMSGVELAQMLLTLDPELPILFVSGHIDRDTLPTAVLSEGSEFLAKPFTPEQLAVRVRDIMDRRFRDLRDGKPRGQGSKR